MQRLASYLFHFSRYEEKLGKGWRTMYIWNHLPSMHALRQISIHQKHINRAMERLSSGMRINRAADDPAGLAISEKMRAQIRGLSQAQRNAQDGISLIQTAEGSLQEIHAVLQRARELSVQAANDTNTPEDRKKIQEEIDELLKGLTQIAKFSEFNTIPLLDNRKLNLQVGANAGQSMELEMPNISLEQLGLLDVNVMDHEKAGEAIDLFDKAIKLVSSDRSRLGAYQNRLEHTLNHLSNYEMNLVDAESRIRSADMAQEIMELTKHQILLQVSLAILAQANQQQQLVLQLLTF